MKYTKYMGWDWDIIPTELRLDDTKGAIVLRCAPSFEPPEDVKVLISKAPAMYKALAEIAYHDRTDIPSQAPKTIHSMRAIAASALEGL